MSTASQFETLPAAEEIQSGLIAVAMSGGVDSSTVAALLQQQGHPLIGLTMQLWNQRALCRNCKEMDRRSTAAARLTMCTTPSASRST